MKRLGKEEWAFWGVPKNELQICFDYELTRERVLQDIERQKQLSPSEVSDSLWLEDVVNELRADARKAAQIDDFDGWIDHQVHYFIAMPYIIPVIYPEWPKKPYLFIDEKVRSDRAKKLTRPKDTDEGCALFLTKIRASDTHVTLSIPNWMTHSKLQALFAGLLRARLPEQGRKRKQGTKETDPGKDQGKRNERVRYSQGRKASSENWLDDLSALSASRLANRGNMSREEIIKHLKRKDGKTSRYSRVKNLDKPMTRAKERMDLCTTWADMLDYWRGRMFPLVLSDPQHALERIKEQIDQEFP
jgi:hypothetical protein